MKPSYLLDSNACIPVLRNKAGIGKLPDPKLTGIPIIVAAELWTGVKKEMNTHPHYAARLEAFLNFFCARRLRSRSHPRDIQRRRIQTGERTQGFHMEMKTVRESDLEQNSSVSLSPLTEQTRILEEPALRLSGIEELETVVSANVQSANFQSAFTGALTNRGGAL